MPYIDLNSTSNPVASVSMGNDLTSLPSNTPTMQNAMQNPQPVSPVYNLQNDLSSKPIMAPEMKTRAISEEHILMRSVPPDFENNPTKIVDGVKEFSGPNLKTNEPKIVESQMPERVIITEPHENLAQQVQNLDLQTVTANPSQKLAPVEVPQPVAVKEEVTPVVNQTVQTQSPVVEIDANANDSEIDQLLSLVIQKGASDLHIAVGFPPILRIDGKLVEIGKQDLTAEDVSRMFTPLFHKRLKEEITQYMDVDFSYSHKTGNRFRINIFNSKGTLAGAFRFISSKIRTIAELNLPNICYDLIKKPHGLILLTGPTGSGKSTSIAAMIQEINMTDARHIVTIEDPIEYIFPRAKSIINQREMGSDTLSWKRSLRELLRQDPNVVVVGEMRDYETIAATITVAETGHLVFATLHTNSASQTIDRIIDVFPDVQQPQIRTQLSAVISAVISQRLIPLVNGGRKAIFEVMVATPAIKNAIRESKTYQIDNIIQTSADQGMIPLEKSLAQLIRNGEITIDIAKEFTNKPDELDSLLKGN